MVQSQRTRQEHHHLAAVRARTSRRLGRRERCAPGDPQPLVQCREVRRRRAARSWSRSAGRPAAASTSRSRTTDRAFPRTRYRSFHPPSARARSPPKSAEQGTGLGLPIVQAILAKHDGQFILKSKLREGTGSHRHPAGKACCNRFRPSRTPRPSPASAAAVSISSAEHQMLADRKQHEDAAGRQHAEHGERAEILGVLADARDFCGEMRSMTSSIAVLSASMAKTVRNRMTAIISSASVKIHRQSRTSATTANRSPAGTPLP